MGEKSKLKVVSSLSKTKAKLKPLDITTKKKDRSLKRESSFEKYEIVLPSFEKIVADHKKFEEHKESVKRLDVFDEGMLKVSLATDCLKEKEFTGELLDCKHVSLEELSKSFWKHLKTLRTIMKGDKFSQRHHSFFKRDAGDVGQDLTCSTSCAVFSYEQKEHLLRLIEAELDPDDKFLGYIFKVLLPELCLLIFMDEHRMTKSDAEEYLDQRPLHFD